MAQHDKPQPADAQWPGGASIRAIDYPGGFYHEQAPIHLKYVGALNGVPSPSIKGSFTYCELGCGVGETVVMLAAANPNGRFYGLDLSPAHIESARALAQASDMANVEFLVADIAGLDASVLPDFDFITLHGLYSWVPTKVQTAIRDFIAAKLKPGGMAYLSYNAMPGWGSAMALRRFFLERVSTIAGDTLTKAARIRDLLEDIRTKEAPFFQQNPTAAKITQHIQNADLRYVAHEYFAQSWQPRYFVDVFDEFVEHGLEYVGSADIVDNFLEHSVKPEFVELLQREPGARSREHLRDFIQNRFFRRDVYRKPDSTPVQKLALTLLNDVHFGLIAAPVQVPGKVNLPDAQSIEFEGAWFERIKQLLAYRALTMDEILSDPVLRQLPENDLIEGIMLMTIGGFCSPFAAREVVPPKGATDVIRVVPKLNSVRLARQDWSEPGFTLASPVTGSGVSLNSLETAFLAAVQLPDPAPWVWSELNARGMTLRSNRDQTPIVDEKPGLAAVREALDQFIRHKLPKLAYLGVVEAG